MVERLTYDSVIVGGGLAGLRAAIEIADNSKVAIVSKLHPLRSNSVSAQGGINAAIGQEDSWQAHMEDTVKGGAFLNDQDAVEVLTKNAKQAIIELENMGALFSRDKKGKLAQRRLGAQSNPRSCYSKDRTGQTLLQTLHEQAQKKGVHIYDEMFATKIVIERGICQGIIALDIKTGKTFALNSKSTLLATGGYARIYGVSSNSQANTGDAHALLLREGLQLMDMEFVQFHPTGLFPAGILIGEAARGHGGMLINDRSERFMQRYDDRGELATRDVISRSIEQEIKSGRGIGKGKFVHLDLTRIKPEIIKEKLPQVRKLAEDFAGVDCLEKPIPVRPTAHYSMGGIPTDKQARVLNRGKPVNGLYAAGECACVSVHGANRVGGNSLLETAVFGKIAGKEMSTFNFGSRVGKIGEEVIKEMVVYVDRVKKRNGAEKMFSIRMELAGMMDKNVGVFREARGLIDAKDKIKELRARWDNLNMTDKGDVFNTELIEALELKNMIDVAEAIVQAASSRKESRGAHYRTDYPRSSNDFLKHALVYREGGSLTIDHKNVMMKNIMPK